MNKVALIGRLTKNPETRYTQTNNICVVSFTLAVNWLFINFIVYLVLSDVIYSYDLPFIESTKVTIQLSGESALEIILELTDE